MPSVLIIEDEADLQEVLRYNLTAAGHTVALAGRGGQGLALCRDRRPDLVILDIMLPDMQGTDIIKALKRDASTRGIPVIMLTAKSEEIDRVLGFELGADDYVTKPFSIRELLLRIQAVLRRVEQTAEPPPVHHFGKLRIDPSAHRAFVDDAEVELTALEFRLLLLLFERRGRVQSRDALLDELWGGESDVEMRTVDSHVKRLREKMGAAAQYVETVRGVGYRFASEAGGDEP